MSGRRTEPAALTEPDAITEQDVVRPASDEGSLSETVNGFGDRVLCELERKICLGRGVVVVGYVGGPFDAM